MSTPVDIDHLTPADVPSDGFVLVRGYDGEVFKMRRVGAVLKRHHYEVWHALAWEQQPLTLTNWKVCASFEAARMLIHRHSNMQSTATE